MSLYKNIVDVGLNKCRDDIAFVCESEIFTYSQVNKKIKEIVKEFESIGVKNGSKVLLKLRHPLKFSLALLALTYLEAIPMPVYHGLGEDKLNNMYNCYDINYVIMSIDDSYRYFSMDRISIKDIGIIYKINEVNDSVLDGTSMILFTSGTTSIPKAIMLTENNICSNVKSISEYLKLSVSDNILLVKDLSHSSSIIGELFVGLYNGCKIVLNTKLLRVVTILNLVQTQKISVYFAVPTLLKELMVSEKRARYDLSSLRIINFYGASMNSEDINNLINIFSMTNIIYSYGQTEASPRVTYIEKKNLINHLTSCGKPINGVRVSIVDEYGKECPAYTKGEIVVEGPNVMKGYYRNEIKTRQILRNNKLFTGDIAYIDEEGFLYVTGRKDNMFINAGKNIYPEEIESVLLSHPDVLEALIEHTDCDNGVVCIIAYVVLKQGVECNVDDIWKFCRQKLEDYKMPQNIHIVQSLEKTPSGKIRRNQFISVSK